MTEEHEVVIQFRNVTKTFDLFKNDKQRLKSLLFHNTNAKKKVAIDNLSFDIRQGEAVAILGKNGAGKSTMLKMISGVTFPTVGSVRVTGRVSALLEVSGGFDPELSGRENIYFRGELLGISREVFERSAFIRQNNLPISQDAELERRIAGQLYRYAHPHLFQRYEIQAGLLHQRQYPPGYHYCGRGPQRGRQGFPR